MINIQQQSMQNWKKQIIMDTHLNPLFNPSISSQQFLSTLLPLPSSLLMQKYIKLTSLKHSLTKSIQKQIQSKHPLIQSIFTHNYSTKKKYQQISNDGIKNSIKSIQKFNQKYQYIQEKLIECQNLNKILHFNKALQKFKVNVRLLNNLMKDFQYNSQNKILSQLLNVIKISKILKEISTIVSKFQFSGIKVYEEEKAGINNVKTVIYGFVQKELTNHLNRIPNQKNMVQLQKDILNKVNILNNINKFKDFFLNYYRNTLKQMSQLCKKCLTIGQSNDQKDIKNISSIFDEYFKNSLHKKIIQNSIIFITFQQILDKNNIKVAFSSNFFQKYWQNLINFIHDLLTWSLQTDSKQILKQKSIQSLYQSFIIYQSKSQINRYLSSIIWKYPILYYQMTSIINQVQLFLVKNARYNHYGVMGMGDRFIREILGVAERYYRGVQKFYNGWKDKINDAQQTQNYPLNFIVLIFDNKTQQLIPTSFKILQWLLQFIKTDQIYQFHLTSILHILDTYFQLFSSILLKYNPAIHTKDNFIYFLSRCKQFYNKCKQIIMRHVPSQKELVVDLNYNESKVVLGDVECLIKLINRFKGYRDVTVGGERRINS